MNVYYMGYKASQMSDHRIWICKDRKIVATIMCQKALTEEKLKQAIKQYIELMEEP